MFRFEAASPVSNRRAKDFDTFTVVTERDRQKKKDVACLITDRPAKRDLS